MVRDPRPSQTAVTLLATTFVLLGGLVAMTFIVVSSTDDPLPIILGVAGGTIALAGLLWILRDRPAGHPLRWQFGWFRGRSASKPVWRVAFKRTPPSEVPPRPPTADRVRELSQNTSTWVPSSRPRKKD